MKEVEKLLVKLEDAIEAGHPVTASIRAKDIRSHLADDRARRIRELVREWVGNGLASAVGPIAFERAAAAIDAIDAAEIPKKGE